MAYTDNLNRSAPILNHAYRAGTVDANRKGLLWALTAIILLTLFAVAYWLLSRDVPEDIMSPQTKETVDRPFNSSVLPATESTPVNQ